MVSRIKVMKQNPNENVLKTHWTCSNKI